MDGTTHLYFKNKEDILIQCFVKNVLFVENSKKIVAGNGTAVSKLLKFLENHFRILSEDHHLAVITQLELRQTNRTLRLEINAILKEYLQLIDEILKQGMENGEFDPAIDIRLARQMIFGTIDETCTTWVMNDYKYDLNSLAPKVHHLILNGCKKQY